MTFTDLSPRQRVEQVERHLAALPDDGPALSPTTTAALTRAKLVLASLDRIDADEHERELLRWRAHLDLLPEHDDDAALYALRSWWLLFDGLMRSAPQPESAGQGSPGEP